jgi:hypothetical protein
MTVASFKAPHVLTAYGHQQTLAAQETPAQMPAQAKRVMPHMLSL